MRAEAAGCSKEGVLAAGCTEFEVFFTLTRSLAEIHVQLFPLTADLGHVYCAFTKATFSHGAGEPKSMFATAAKNDPLTDRSSELTWAL